MQQNGSSTSGFQLRATEKLGNGLQANFIFGTDFNVVSRVANTGAATATTAGDASLTNGTFGNGELGGGLSGDFGRFDIGHLTFNTLTTTGGGQPFGTAIGSGYGSIYRVNAAASMVRDDNAFRYQSPSMNGLVVSLYKSYKQTKSGTGIAADTNFNAGLGAYDKLGSQEVGLNYSSGPFAASVSSLTQDSQQVGAGNTESKVNTVSANYTMGAAKLFILNQTNKNSGSGATAAAAVDTNYTSVSGTYVMGKTTLLAQFGTLKADAGSNAGKSSTITGLGIDYALSKMTNAYVRYESIKDDAGIISASQNGNYAPVGDNVTRTRTAMGVKFAF
jgi:predicted porin